MRKEGFLMVGRAGAYCAMRSRNMFQLEQFSKETFIPHHHQALCVHAQKETKKIVLFKITQETMI